MKNIFIALALSLLASTTFAGVDYLYPQTFSELRKSTVMIIGNGGASSGSGVILRSKTDRSLILTNSHVCAILARGGSVVSWKGEFAVHSYIKSKQHDVCLVKVRENLGVDNKIAKDDVEFGDTTVVSGHPTRLPAIIARGHATNKMTIRLVTGVKQCSSSDWQNAPMFCLIFGGMPIIQTLESRVISNIIAPGSSGSGVFNSSGEIVGLVFAGQGRSLSRGFIVPHAYVRSFIREVVKNPRWIMVENSMVYSPGSRTSDSSYGKSTPYYQLDNDNEDLMFIMLYDPQIETIMDQYECLRSNRFCLPRGEN